MRNNVMSDIREKTIQNNLRYCQHYDPPIRGIKSCKAGVVYDDQFPLEKKPTPCWTGYGKTDEEQRARCKKWLRRTQEQAEARADEIEAAMNRMRIVGPIVAEWRKKPPIGKYEKIECPVCNGRLHLNQSSCNGHVHGKCETQGCVSWME
jgi:hypothetical protein